MVSQKELMRQCNLDSVVIVLKQAMTGLISWI